LGNIPQFAAGNPQDLAQAPNRFDLRSDRISPNPLSNKAVVCGGQSGMAIAIKFELDLVVWYGMGEFAEMNPHPRIVMKWIKQLSLVAVVMCLAAAAAIAQTNVNTATQPTRDGTSVLPEKLTVTDDSIMPNLRPARGERQKLPPEVLARIERFKREARAYLNQQEALKKKLQGVNDKERAEIRDRLKTLRDQWLDQAREFRKELRERQRELLDKLPDYREVIESARNAAAQQSPQTPKDSRTHQGED